MLVSCPLPRSNNGSRPTTAKCSSRTKHEYRRDFFNNGTPYNPSHRMFNYGSFPMPEASLKINVPVLILNGKADAANLKVATLLSAIPTAFASVCEGDHHSAPYQLKLKHITVFDLDDSRKRALVLEAGYRYITRPRRSPRKSPADNGHIPFPDEGSIPDLRPEPCRSRLEKWFHLALSKQTHDRTHLCGPFLSLYSLCCCRGLLRKPVRKMEHDRSLCWLPVPGGQACSIRITDTKTTLAKLPMSSKMPSAWPSASFFRLSTNNARPKRLHNSKAPPKEKPWHRLIVKLTLASLSPFDCFEHTRNSSW